MRPRWPATWGWPGAVALAALALAAPMAGLLTPQWQREAAALRRTPLPVARPAPAAPALPALPAARDPATAVADLLTQAVRDGLTVERVQQKLDSASPLPRLQLTLAVRGRYARLRAHIENALAADAALSLERVQLRRAGPNVDELDAELEWSVLVDLGRARAAP